MQAEFCMYTKNFSLGLKKLKIICAPKLSNRTSTVKHGVAMSLRF